mmetsp:Transcript_111888/g.241248  ORF Transcript_111888/g.241248 Transcript_111888/m.241248 type:complete len:81 (-) Transcript_111888:990-1232(-)
MEGIIISNKIVQNSILQCEFINNTLYWVMNDICQVCMYNFDDDFSSNLKSLVKKSVDFKKYYDDFPQKLLEDRVQGIGLV